MHIRAGVIVLLMMFTVVACASTPPTPVPLPTSTPAPTYTPFSTYTPYPTFTPFPTFTPIPRSSLTPTFIPTSQKPYSTVFGIDYSQPGIYLAQGEQTRLSNQSSIYALRGKPQSIAHLGEIYFWIARGFTSYAAGGASIGKMTTDQLFVDRRLSGCHDWALVFASIARDLGYPAVLIDTAGVSWAKRFRAGEKGGYLGHVFVEVFVDSKWVLVDSTNNWYVDGGYDPANAFVPLKMGSETEGLFAMRKGVDTWGYGIRSNSELTRLMEESANALKVESIKFPSYVFQRFK